MNNPNEASVWYEEWFDQKEYDVVYRKRDEADARKLLALIERVTKLDQGARVLDMACGRGRHAILLARRGFQVTGIDLSPRAIETARQMAVVESLSIEFETGDMRDSPCTACFDLVVNLFTSFGYFDDDVENARAVHAMAESLVTGGWLVQDFMNGGYWSTHFVPYDERSENGMVLKQRRWVERDRLNKEITFVKDDGSEQKF
ncbi:MAG: class I SAM-dependent methyltransferase, partial [Rhodothermia bacterium]